MIHLFEERGMFQLAGISVFEVVPARVRAARRRRQSVTWLQARNLEGVGWQRFMEADSQAGLLEGLVMYRAMKRRRQDLDHRALVTGRYYLPNGELDEIPF